VIEPLQGHLDKAQALHRQDVAEGFGEMHLPYALGGCLRNNPSDSFV
jgi:hypothetical protein